MNSKPVLMIHEIKDSLFDLPLEDYVLTFDDGLYSHYYHFDKFKKIKTQKIFFISTDIICDGAQSTEFPSSVVAHDKAFAGNKEDFMTLEQIKELAKDPLVSIGAHGHFHKNLDQIPKLFDKLKHIEDDAELMMNWFETNLGFIPKQFCYPYNNDLKGMYATLLKKYGFNEFYGAERIPA
jgi:Polysaccharide deacetylase